MFIGSKKHQSTVIEASNNLIKMQLKEKVAIDRTNHQRQHIPNNER